MTIKPTLNERAQRQADFLAANAANLRIAVRQTAAGARLIDCGVEVVGGLQAGLGMARVCLCGLGDVGLVPGEVGGVGCPVVQVLTDHPVLACMASQYAGWPISLDEYFAMGSGPMRAVRRREPLFADIGGGEEAPVAVGVLETGQLPTDEAVAYVAEEVRLPPAKVTLLAAPAPSMAGTIQVVARSLETALHKLHELKFDLRKVLSGFGAAPLPPVSEDNLTAIGRTNDAIIYGGRVNLYLEADDEEIAEVGAKVPASSSPDYGTPFAQIFERCGHDFYKIDKMLFSPAEVVFHNLRSGRSQAFGRVRPEVMLESFFGR